MESAVGTNHRVRFQSFELDLHTRELYRNGTRLRLQGQPIDVLEMLLERPGELVTREQLRKKLWPQDTFVDFEHSLNSTIARLREALGDHAEEPRFIETLPRLGYRFIELVEIEAARVYPYRHETDASVARPQAAEVVPISMPREQTQVIRSSPGEERPKNRRMRVLVLGSGIVLLSSAVVLRLASPPLQPPRISQQVRITNDPRHTGKLIIGVDEGSVFMKLEEDSPVLGQVAIDGGEITTTRIGVPDLTRLDAVSPNGNFVVCHGKNDLQENTSDLWIARTTGVAIQYLAKGCPVGATASWSPDGKEVIYSTADGKIYVVPSSGGTPRLLQKLNGQAILFAYSPDGSKVRFSFRENKLSGVWRIWEMSSQGENLHELLPNWRPYVRVWNGRWTPDGEIFIFLVTEGNLRLAFTEAPNQIWALDERHRLFRRSNPEPVQLRSGPGMWSSPFPSRDGRVIFAESIDSRGSLLRFNRHKKQVEPYLGGVSGEMLDYSRDGNTLVYVSFPSGSLWRANRDGSAIRQIAKASQYSVSPQLSPDGSQIVFTDFVRRQGSVKSSMYLVSSRGGTPVEVLPDDPEDEYDPTWSPDGKKLAYGLRVYWQSKRADPNKEVRIVDLASKTVLNLPAPPKRARSPRWSPDGRYIVCLTAPGDFVADDGIEIYDFKSGKWSVILDGQPARWPTWSSDSRWIYYVDYRYKDGGRLAFYQIEVNGGRPETIADLAEFRSTGFYWNWFGFDPDGNPLVLRDDGTDEIYALTLER
jgi:Tol biopolymer transport system component/DNA-binding winged helix-turn-helix (wHTH) protein